MRKLIEITEVYPSYYGGQKALQEYLRENIIYPAEANEKGITGGVKVSFMVDVNGKIQNVTISESDSNLFDQEAKRIVREMGDWQPGNERGRTLNIYMTLPINFYLSE